MPNAPTSPRVCDARWSGTTANVSREIYAGGIASSTIATVGRGAAVAAAAEEERGVAWSRASSGIPASPLPAKRALAARIPTFGLRAKCTACIPLPRRHPIMHHPRRRAHRLRLEQHHRRHCRRQCREVWASRTTLRTMATLSSSMLTENSTMWRCYSNGWKRSWACPCPPRSTPVSSHRFLGSLLRREERVHLLLGCTDTSSSSSSSCGVGLRQHSCHCRSDRSAENSRILHAKCSMRTVPDPIQQQGGIQSGYFVSYNRRV